MKWLLLVTMIIIFSGTLLLNKTLAEENLRIETDKTIYFLREAIIVSGYIDILGDTDYVKIEIISPDGVEFGKKTIQIDDDQEFSAIISVVESYWNREGLYRIRATYEDQVSFAYVHVFSSEKDIPRVISSTIGFDKPVYSWVDRVEIFVISPSFNKDKSIEYIGATEENKIIISSGLAKLENYQLKETSGNSGVFRGLVTLTGNSNVDVDGDKRKNDAEGITSGIGPDDGKLAVSGNDQIEIKFVNEEESISAVSNVLWNKGKISWEKNFFKPDSIVRVFLTDPDLNVKSEIVDYITIRIWSDIDATKKLFKLKETGKRTGVFEGLIPLTSQTETTSKIKTKQDDKLHALYVDYTVPQKESSFLNVESSVIITSQDDSVTADESSQPELVTPSETKILRQSATSDSFGTIQVEQQKYVVKYGNRVIVNISGEVNKGQKGTPVYLQIVHPDGKISQSKVLLGNNNQFSSTISLDYNRPSGIYEISASYHLSQSEKIGFELLKEETKPPERVIIIPSWIKNTAKWWGNDQISDDGFSDGLEYLIKEGTIRISTKTVNTGNTENIPTWVKNNAKWWSEGILDDSDFVKGIEYLVENGIIQIK